MGFCLYGNPVVQRSKRKTTRRWSAGCKVWQRFLYLHQLFLVSTIAGWSPGILSLVREYAVIGKMSARDDNENADSWRKAYGLTLSLFAVEVMLLYLFTLRFS